MKNKNDSWNLLFSAFLITAFMICSSFFIGMISDSFGQDQIKSTLFTAAVFLVFGLILFYSTRVGDGKQVFRFSPATLIVMVLPALYVVIASVVSGLPFYAQVSSRPELANIAAVILGYGIPYTFLSGYELDTSENENSSADSDGDDGNTEDSSGQTEENDDDVSDGDEMTDDDDAAEDETEDGTEDETDDKTDESDADDSEE